MASGQRLLRSVYWGFLLLNWTVSISLTTKTTVVGLSQVELSVDTEMSLNIPILNNTHEVLGISIHCHNERRKYVAQ